MIKHVFLALGPSLDHGAREWILIDSVIPGQSDLFRFIRDFGNRAGLGRYRRLDLNPDNDTHGFHLFEKGIVRIITTPEK